MFTLCRQEPVAPPAPPAAPGASTSKFPVLKADPTMQDAVRGAISHAWANYKKYAWGADNLKPLSHSSSNNFLSAYWGMGLLNIPGGTVGVRARSRFGGQ